MPNFEEKTRSQLSAETSRSEFEKKTLMGALKDEAVKENTERVYAEKEVKAMNEMPEKEIILNKIKERFYDGREKEALKNFDERINDVMSDYGPEFVLGYVNIKDGHFKPTHLGAESVEEFRAVLKFLESGRAIIGAREVNGERLIVSAYLNEEKNKESFDSESLDPVDLDGPEGPERG